jgi:16S rRNA processing protein RimM
VSADASICIGVIVGAHGVRGALKIKSFTANAGDVAAYGPVGLGPSGRPVALKIEGAGKGDVIHARIDGIDDRDAALALKGTELYVARERLPTLADDEFYHADLIGLAVESKAGDGLGRVQAIHNFGAGDLIEVASECGNLMLPFTRAVVPVVDMVGGRIVVDPPIGLREGDR